MNKRLDILDYARFIAVLFVISFHYTFNGIANGKVTSITHIPFIIEYSKYGYLGVELFFLISGYVIFYSAKNRTASQFATARALRLYPSYWFAIIFTSTFAYFWGGNLMSVNLSEIFVNFTMFQSYLGYANVDGVYWTLVFEVQFYLAVFVLLFIGVQKYFDAIFIAWPILILLAFLLHLHILFLGGYFSYFAAGALFAIMKEKKTLPVFLSTIVAYVLSVYFSITHLKYPSLNEYILNHQLNIYIML
jgi:peptidoglycan/LPS O-acetylase OafA/YrhL